MADKKSLRITGFFATKKEGMLVGKIKPDEIEELKALLNSQSAARQGVVFFLFENDRPGTMKFTLFGNIDKSMEQSTSRDNRSIGAKVSEWD
jgi:hypothetical protein